MHDDAGLARTGPGQHQMVAVQWRGHDGLLFRVAQVGQDAPVGRFGGGHFEHVLASRKVAADEFVALEAEVIDDEGHGGLDFAQCQPRVLGHDMNLDDLVLVVQCQLGVVRLLELPATRLGIELDGHGRPEDRLAARQVEYLVGVEVEKRCGQRVRPVAYIEILERQVTLQRRLQVALLCGHDQVVALPVSQEIGHQGLGQTHSLLADRFYLLP